MSLGQAVRKYVEPGMSLHLGMACTPPLAVIYELVRQFRGKDPRFALLSLGLTTVFSLLVHTGLLRKATTTFLGDSYPLRDPIPFFRKPCGMERWISALVLAVHGSEAKGGILRSQRSAHQIHPGKQHGKA